jgi:hypothetical protein
MSVLSHSCGKHLLRHKWHLILYNVVGCKSQFVAQDNLGVVPRNHARLKEVYSTELQIQNEEKGITVLCGATPTILVTASSMPFPHP